jgi:3alpha(or 20beta)-hydroxysteroid dehydrogenase
LNDQNRLDGRIALVTGGARGIGREIAITLARQGATVVAADVLLPELEDLASFARDRKHAIFCRPLDVTSPEQWSELAHYIDREFRKLDILVNNAGIMRARHFFDTTIEDFQTTMRVNVESMFLGAKTLVPLLTKAGQANPAGAAIINMCSVTPMGRVGRVDDIAGVVAFLASDAAKFMTGSDVTVDGGYSMV